MRHAALANPRPYPKGRPYGDLLKWHLKEWGTHPNCTKIEQSDLPHIANFARSLHLKESDQGDPVKNLRNWMDSSKSPPQDDYPARKIMENLFYDSSESTWNPATEDWADELWLARKAYYGDSISNDWYKDLDKAESQTASKPFDSYLNVASRLWDKVERIGDWTTTDKPWLLSEIYVPAFLRTQTRRSLLRGDEEAANSNITSRSEDAQQGSRGEQLEYSLGALLERVHHGRNREGFPFC